MNYNVFLSSRTNVPTYTHTTFTLLIFFRKHVTQKIWLCLLTMFTLATSDAQPFQINCQPQDCGGLCYSFTSNLPVGVTLNWNFGDGTTLTTTDVTVTHCYTNVNTYSNINEKHTVTLSAFGAQQQETLIHNNCQEGVFIGATNGTTDTYLTNYSALPGSGFVGAGTQRDVHVYGAVWIDKNFLFDGANISMSPSAGFKVGGDLDNVPYALTLQNNTTVGTKHNCNCLWRGIELHGGTLFTRTNTTLENALYAIAVRENHTLFVEDTHFTDNFVGILGYGPAPLRNFTLSGSTFSTTPLATLPGWCGGQYILGDGGDPYFASGSQFFNDRGWAGICLIGMSTDVIGKSTGAINVFQDLANGIVLELSSVGKMAGTNIIGGISQCQFVRMQRGGYPAAIGGYGISFDDARGTNFMQQVGFGMDGLVSFDDCEVGVRGTCAGFFGNTIITSTDNRMVGVELGYRILDVTGSNEIDISSNTILADVSYNNDLFNRGGIRVEMSAQTDNINIQLNNNDIDVDQDGITHLRGIFVRSAVIDPVANPFDVTINDNFVDILNEGDGIAVSNLFAPAVQGNVITMADVNLSTGIFIAGGENVNVLCNDIFGPLPETDPSFAFQSGIKAGFASFAQIRDNHVTNFDEGFRFDFTNNDVDFGCNDMLGDNNRGLFCAPGASMGAQPDRGNVWDCNSLIFEAEHSSQFIASGQQFFAQQGTSAFPDSHTPFIWFQHSNNPTPACPTTPGCPLNITGGGGTNSLDSIVAQGLLTGESEGTVKDLEKNLYRKLTDNPDLLIGNTLLQTFVNANSNAPIGQFYDLTKAVSAIFRVPSNVQAQLDTKNAAIAANLFSMDSLESLMATNPPPAQYSIYQQEYDLLVTANDQLDNDIAIIYGDMLTDRATKADNLILTNNAINATTVPDLNEKQVLGVLLNTIGKSNPTPTSTQLATLNSIASQCPQDGGKAVLTAILLHGYLTGSNLQFQPCSSSSGGGGPLNYEHPSTGFNVYPNPSNGEVSITYELEKDQVGAIKIFDQYGRTIRQFGLSSSDKKLNIQGIVSGFYHIQFSIDGAVFRSEKLVVQ